MRRITLLSHSTGALNLKGQESLFHVATQFLANTPNPKTCESWGFLFPGVVEMGIWPISPSKNY